MRRTALVCCVWALAAPARYGVSPLSLASLNGSAAVADKVAVRRERFGDSTGLLTI